ncbi:hypothetical protein [Agarivorans gilvus]|uniref:Lipoprotein n=1 Tax=Agarivorans gilvus TaxID=680279 RepID=A0ABQ1I6T5_9ALTE|nr:hypothetical protein [Agarivorans gilvus]GGB22404.1 hypothetical protein GCM10007414_39680 [Agarivorans gilvus]
MQKSIILGVLLLPLAACTTPQTSNSFNVQSADFSNASDDNLCIVYGYHLNRSLEAQSELIKRNLFTSSEWAMISQHQVVNGMSECAVKAAFAINYKQVFNTKFNNGDKGKSFIYSCSDSNVPYCPFTRVDLVNGKVSSVSSVEKI